MNCPVDGQFLVGENVWEKDLTPEQIEEAHHYRV